jgi:hypothetical protein
MCEARRTECNHDKGLVNAQRPRVNSLMASSPQPSPPKEEREKPLLRSLRAKPPGSARAEGAPRCCERFC